jgi:ADP-heptose:LPS heptosyltransferase
MPELIPDDVLKNAKSILFFTHCAIGDFTYLGSYFKKVAEKYPNIKVDLWADEVRRTYKFWRWKYIKRYVLHDWLHSCSFFNKVYTETYTWGLFKKTFKEVQADKHSIIVSLYYLRSRRYSKHARRMNPDAFLAGFKSKHGNNYHWLDSELPYKLEREPFKWHITDLYDQQFKQLFDIELTREEKLSVLKIPEEWKDYGKNQIASWKAATPATGPSVFINTFAKDEKRCWDHRKIKKLIALMRDDERYKDAVFVVNAPPAGAHLLPEFDSDVLLFSGGDNFFQLPSMLDACDLIISVETSIGHLAVSLGKKIIPLIRSKNPEWIPLGLGRDDVIMVNDRRDWVEDIPVERVWDHINKLQK